MVTPLSRRTSHWRWTTFAVALLCTAVAGASSLEFFENAASDYDYGRQNTIPAGFGTGEFTLEIWLRPDSSLPVGSTDSGTNQLRNWSNANPTPYSSSSWWYAGNFLLDGHNNTSYSSGTFSLQFFNGGRLRWLFGDGAPADARSGDLHAVQNASGASLLDGQWHQVTLVRRQSGSGATLEMWIDGALSDTETTSEMTDMRQWWNNWTGFPQAGWIWGAEKQAALGQITQYEDYKGNIDELRFWSIAKSSTDIAQNYRARVTGAETGLAGHYTFEATSPCNQVGGGGACINASNLKSGALSSAEPPLTGSGGGSDTSAPTVPANLRASGATASGVNLAWDAATDNVGVAGYDLYRDGDLIASPTATSYTDSGLTAASTYIYTVRARDAAGNASDRSGGLTVTTITVTQPPPSGGSGGGGGGGQFGLGFIVFGFLALLARRGYSSPTLRVAR
ncbi:hypothetical protein HNQ60_000510 [Povalibacter uvarum]|uniref:Fibronectin type-III domain-containing protein n=1 Tax=Povalibacter uvarum TaxID=732238 RepID=A0A841HGH2_9GAMM|nr:LamG-like jellyroll fold domain-containing protein [Povalibacter uvarum]MBB6091664.1 hypothetical protein [Povalibacter uvarum]